MRTFQGWLGIYLCCLLLLVGCGESGNDLRGSIEKDYDLSFDRVESRWLQNVSVALIYSDPIPDVSTRQEALRLEFDLSKVTIVTDVPLDLNQAGITMTRSRFILGTSGDWVPDTRPFPAIISGSVIFKNFEFVSDAAVSGNFSVIFLGGLTMLGSFNTNLKFGIDD